MCGKNLEKLKNNEYFCNAMCVLELQNTEQQHGATPNQSAASAPIRLIFFKPRAPETPRWVRASPAAGLLPPLLCLIHGDPSSLITHQPDSPTNRHHTLTHTHTNTPTNQGHQAKRSLI